MTKMIFKKFSFSLFVFIAITGTNLDASEYSVLTVEELRIKKAEQTMPGVTERLKTTLVKYEKALLSAKNHPELRDTVRMYANNLWKIAVNSLKSINDFDDRPLYWSRLEFSKLLRQNEIFQSLQPLEQKSLLRELEFASRGIQDIRFGKGVTKKILITGFDPFFLDRNIDQSNPSGVVAMLLDGQIITNADVSAEIQTAVIPVRFVDFDQGMIEEIMTPYVTSKAVDMIITISMGRDDFDLERFPGLRRSAKAPDNLNVYTGANKDNPLVPMLNNDVLDGPEFLEFSLPASAMKQAVGDFKINDNHQVSTLEETYSPYLLEQLSKQISVQGSGGGYLSNEISYRSLLVRNTYYPALPVGHIHTPRFKGFKPEKTQKIFHQVKQMLTLALIEL